MFAMTCYSSLNRLLLSIKCLFFFFLYVLEDFKGNLMFLDCVDICLCFAMCDMPLKAKILEEKSFVQSPASSPEDLTSPKSSDFYVKERHIILRKTASAEKEQVKFRPFSYTTRKTKRTKIFYFYS